MDADSDSPIQPSLFPLPPIAPDLTRPVPAHPKQGARLREAQRAQIRWGPLHLDAQLPMDHSARSIWAVVDKLDLSALYSPIEARDSTAGASAIDPKILLSLWVYGTSDGIGSGREIWRLTKLHDGYRWLCGGVDVGYHTLTDFRRDNGSAFDDFITQILALLLKHDLVTLHRLAQDGTRVRASAGASSFRRGQTLESLRQEVRAYLEAVTRDARDPAISTQRAAARRRGAQERLDRLDAAIAELPDVEATKKRSGAKDATPRVSTTDPQARVMKMGDGGFRPAYNVQFATTTDSARVIVGVEVTNRGSDMGESTPMLDQVERRTGSCPKDLLVDGGYPAHDAIDAADQRGVTVYAPLPKPRQDDPRDPHAPREGDSAAVAAWRARMATEEAKTIYKERAATAETVNADGKANRGLDRFWVRGIENVSTSAKLFALTYNILRFITLKM
jgi:transposase